MGKRRRAEESFGSLWGSGAHEGGEGREGVSAAMADASSRSVAGGSRRRLLGDGSSHRSASELSRYRGGGCRFQS